MQNEQLLEMAEGTYKGQFPDDINADKRIFCDTMMANIKLTKQLFKFWDAHRSVNKLIEIERFLEKWQTEFMNEIEDSQKTSLPSPALHELGD